jgi:hypothetical protein
MGTLPVRLSRVKAYASTSSEVAGRLRQSLRVDFGTLLTAVLES